MRASRFLLILVLCAPLAAQPVAFGSSDDPLEWGSTLRPEDGLAVGAGVGPAYLPDEWRAGAHASLDASTGRFSLGLGQTIHSGDSGLYGPEDDELYDLARVLRYARWNAVPGQASYARLGPTQRVSLGVGALVSRYRTTTAWDERRIGAEGSAGTRTVRATAFVDDVLRADGIVGGEVTLRSGLRVGPVTDLGLTLGGVHDLGQSGLSGDSSLTGVEATVRGAYAGLGPVLLRPFVTHAQYLGKGGTVGVGVDVGAPNIGDQARARARVAVFASSGRFVPGHVGPFYSISNATDRIVDDGSFYAPGVASELAGTPLDSLSGGVDLVADLRLIVFGRLEVSQYARRHIGDERASSYSLRLAARLPDNGLVEFGLERQDFRGFFDLIQDLGALNTLVLNVHVPVGDRGMVFVRSRYGYRRLTEADGAEYADGPPRFLVERRFEPMVGLRFGR